MRKFEEKREKRNLAYSKPVVILLFLILVVLARATWYGYQGFMLSKKNREVARLEKEELETRIFELENDIKKLETDRGLEGEIRGKFGVAKEGEGVIMLVDSSETSTDEVKEGKGFWGTIMNWFR